MVSVTRTVFGELPSGGGTVEKFQLQSDLLRVDIISWGCTITALEVKDRQGRASDVVLGFAELEGGLQPGPRPHRADLCRARDLGKVPSLGPSSQGMRGFGGRGKSLNANSCRIWRLVTGSGFASVNSKRN
jgi:hypothetical protein